MKNEINLVPGTGTAFLKKIQKNSLLCNWELLTVILGSILGTILIAYFMIFFRTDRWDSDFFHFWKVWDTNHYIALASKGYTKDGDTSNLIVFFPLYPLLIRVFHFVCRDWMVSAFAVSNISYAIAAAFLYKLVRMDYRHTTAIQTVICFSLFPTAFFLHAGYTESLFMATVISSFYFARKGHWLAAALCGMLATATRLNGIVMFPALLIEYLEQRRFKISRDIGWLVMVFLGTLSYLLLNKFIYGSYFAFLEKQSTIWTKSIAMPWTGFFGHVRTLFNTTSAQGGLNVNLTEAFYGLSGLLLAIYAAFKLRTSYVIYTFYTWILFSATNFWLSLPRYTLSLFPIFILFGMATKKKWVNFLYMFLGTAFYIFYLGRLLQGNWTF